MQIAEIKLYLHEIENDFLEKFCDYFQKNPSVWRLFKQYSEKVKGTRGKYSAWAIINQIRWHHEIEKGGDDFKISNDYIGLYARLLARSDREYLDFFSLKEMKRVNKFDQQGQGLLFG